MDRKSGVTWKVKVDRKSVGKENRIGKVEKERKSGSEKTQRKGKTNDHPKGINNKKK